MTTRSICIVLLDDVEPIEEVSTGLELKLICVNSSGTFLNVIFISVVLLRFSRFI